MSLQFAGRVGREDHPRRIAPDARHADKQPEQLALGLGRKTVEQLRILAHDVVHEEFGRLGMLDRREGFERDVEVITDAPDIENGMRGSGFGNGAADVFVHKIQILDADGQK